jgi:hypothetical protein
MKTLNESFTDQDFADLKQAKGKMTWHNFIMQLTKPIVIRKGGFHDVEEFYLPPDEEVKPE